MTKFFEGGGPAVAQSKTEKLLRQWFYVGQPITSPSTGLTGRVFGFGKKYIQRGGFDHKRAGIYFDFTKVLFVNQDGCEQILDAGGYISSYSSALEIPNDTEKMREKIRALNVRISDLPDTPFWEGDIVQLCPQDLNKYAVSTLDYPSGRPNSFMTLDHSEFQITFDWLDHSKITRVERGNIWKLEHGEPLSFSGATEAKRLEEEAAFYKSLGMSEVFQISPQVVNTWGSRPGKHHLWDIGLGIKMLREGQAHQVKIKNDQAVIIRYEKKEFGERMRAAELKRLGLEAEKVPYGNCVKKI